MPQWQDVPPVDYSGLEFNPTTAYNAFPPALAGVHNWDPNFMFSSASSNDLAYVNAVVDPMHWMDTMVHQYSNYFRWQYPVPEYRERALAGEEQIELTESLEENIPDVSAQLTSEFMTFHRS